MKKNSLKNYGNPYAKKADSYKKREHQEKRDLETTLKKIRSGYPMMGKNE